MVILTTKIYIQQPLKNSTLPWHHQTTWLILILATIVNFYFWAMPFYYILLHWTISLRTEIIEYNTLHSLRSTVAGFPFCVQK